MVKIPTRVLIVDDEKDFVEMLSIRLDETGEKVALCEDGGYIITGSSTYENNSMIFLLKVDSEGNLDN